MLTTIIMLMYIIMKNTKFRTSQQHEMQGANNKTTKKHLAKILAAVNWFVFINSTVPGQKYIQKGSIEEYFALQVFTSLP